MKMKTRRPTMSDVAKRAEVSQSTVSLVLNGVSGVRISEITRTRVHEAAIALGYRFGPRGTNANTSETRTIGFIVNELATSPFAAMSVDAAREAAWEQGCLLFVISTRSEPDLENQAIARLMAEPLAGVIYASIMTREVVVPEALRTVPTVLLNCRSADRTFSSVVPSDVGGSHVATAHLIAAGHRRVGFINGEPWMDAARDRLKGYRQALATHDVPFDPTLVREGNWLLDGGYKETKALMRLPNPPTAISCANDRMAIGCYQALQELNKQIPQDVAVVGYDDEEFARHMAPPLTTVLLPHQEMGRWAVAQLLDRTETAKTVRVKMECPLIERASA